jgi:hypothetical protein
MQARQWGEALTTCSMKNHVHYLVFQLLSNLTEIWVEIPVAPGVALDRQCFVYD